MLLIRWVWMAVPARAFWRMPCAANPLVMSRADPLLAPGRVSGHAHAIYGASNFNLDVDFDTLRKSKCTSCQVSQDMSNYWTPMLYFHTKDDKFEAVERMDLLVYYEQRPHKDDKFPIKAPPANFRMIAGNPYRRSYDPDDPTHNNIKIRCIGAQNTIDPWFPTRNCEMSLRTEIRFPDCWDGENVDSPNHQSHMSYAEGEFGPCPDSHPHRIINIFAEYWYSTDPWKDRWDEAMNSSQPFVFAMGDPTGYGAHADFMNGWDVDVLQKAVDECLDSEGLIERCGAFELYDWSNGQTSCTQTSAVDETVTGTLDALPGCNKVDAGPKDVSVCTEEKVPGLKKKITVGGTLAGGDFEIDVVSKDSSATTEEKPKEEDDEKPQETTATGGSGGEGGGAEATTKTKAEAATNTAGGGGGTSSAKESKTSGAAGSASTSGSSSGGGSSSSGGGSGSSGGGSSSSSADTSSADESSIDQKWLWIGGGGAAIVLIIVVVAVVLSKSHGAAKHSSGRGEKKHLHSSDTEESSEESDSGSSDDSDGGGGPRRR